MAFYGALESLWYGRKKGLSWLSWRGSDINDVGLVPGDTIRRTN